TVYVSLDLETSGIDPAKDAIIEIGAVKFDENGVLEEFQTLVNPCRPLDPFVQELTGICDEDLATAPSLEAVRPALQLFLADLPLVGHNVVAFDVPFLASAGIYTASEVFDTWELAALLLPASGEYSLRALAERYGIENSRPHRALPDAMATLGVFRGLQRQAAALPAPVLAAAQRCLAQSRWSARQLLEEAAITGARPPSPYVRAEELRPLERQAETLPILPEELRALFAQTAASQVLPGFEERAEQVRMAQAVARALNDGEQLLVEAGTGTGKSLAYLVPSALYALRNGSRVVVSTNTLNLQQQLLEKDIPALGQMLAAGGIEGELRSAALKGRRNYLCLRRLHAFEPDAETTEAEARLLARLHIWAAETQTGDRSELRLRSGDQAIWQRLSAEDARCSADNCPYVVDGSCFLVRARRRAEAAHLLVVNHALLLSDVTVEGRLLPAYESLIVDEAHHLEDEATNQLGFRTNERELGDFLEACHHLASSIRGEARRGVAALSPLAPLSGLARSLDEAADRASQHLQQLLVVARQFLHRHAADASDYDSRLTIASGARSQPDWSEIEIAWDNLDLSLSNLLELLRRLAEALLSPDATGMFNRDSLAGETVSLLEDGSDLRKGLSQAIERDDPHQVVWLEEDRERAQLALSSVPLDVAPLLQEGLYAERNAVVMTSATLRTADPGGSGFAFIRRRLGLEDATELDLGSPFDFQRAALVLLPTDMVEPNWPEYVETLARSLQDLTLASEGRALCLFTSNATLRAVHRLLQPQLAAAGINVYGQGIDGTPAELVRTLRRNPRSLVLGAASFWEGIDIVGQALSLLVVARLPFSVPTEPVYAARSALFEEPFNQFALPQAALRLKQGFGRLIRSHSDRGVMVVLDGRINSKSYGEYFLRSLPPAQVLRKRLRDLPAETARWLGAEATQPS
ncbi:MAG TPA: helicase C-terminal domain-containing protein, partial [Dehalococcoidia bacterium]|nr:helicase C-terminal domain-containing protein [Dehalococcoidia bacterium]